MTRTVSGLVVLSVTVQRVTAGYVLVQGEDGGHFDVEPDLVSPDELHLVTEEATARHATWTEDRVGGSRVRCEAISFGDVAAWEEE